ncbi:efflux RND transporter permease subunit [Ignavibacteria bacterium]|nr:efflux RND transporter permease subunit [Bacteroidota bacterium]MCZ2131753.1 efflux RND transporter permease subunit [Bacteroidota bacterium]
MSNFSHTFIKRPVLAIVVNLAIVLFGAIGFTFLGIREFPSIDPPIITVRTSYTGANADIIESQITEPLEKAINGIAGIRTISSASNQGSSSITVEFDLGVDMESAANDVRDKVSQAVRQLPQDIDGLPIVSKADASSDAIVSMTIRSNARSHMEISDYAENILAQRFTTIPGVSTVQIWGQKKYSMRIWMDPSKLAAYKLTPLDVQQAIRKENVELPAGKISGDKTELTVKTSGRLSNESEFNNLIISSDADKVVRLKDIGYAEIGPENEETILRESNVPMIGIALVPQPGSNYIDITDEFYRRMEQLKKEIPEDYTLNIALDNTEFIKRSVTEVGETILIAIVLVILIIYLFFRDWLVAIRPLIDIPVSLIGAFFIMYIMGFSVNILTLLAIVLATGLVVDDGIVVTENIYKKVEEGLSPLEAAFKGSTEIFFAVISTSVTLAAVFLPVIFMEGFVGRLFREFGVVIAGAVLISAFVSLTLTPMLNAKMIRSSHKKSRFYELTEPFFEGMENIYRNSLNAFMKRRQTAFVIILLCAGLIIGLGYVVPSELAPLEDRGWLRMQITAPEGASYEYTDSFMKKLTRFINDSIPEKEVCLTVTAPSFAGSGAVNTGFMRLRFSDASKRERSQQQIADYLSKQTSNFSEARSFVIQEQTISAGGSRGLPVQFVLQAPNFEKLKEVLPKFLDKANQSPVFQGVDVNLKFTRPEISIAIDRDKIKDLGLSAADIAQTLQTAFSGQRFDYYIMNGKQYQVIGQVSRENRDAPIDLKSLYARNSRGELIQMDNVVTLTEQSNPPQLYHYNRYMSATVSAGLAPGKTIADGINEMESIASSTLDDSFSTALTGASRDFVESSSNVIFAFLLALVLIYLMLAAQFESFRDPFIIMLTVPLAIAGAILSLWYFNQTLNIFSEIGIIMLIGLVTKNGILIVEFANQLQEKGMGIAEAIHEAAILRLRPILMTSIATVLGAMPIALALGAGAKSRMGMGIVVVGGVLFSLVLTLYVIPAMYSYLSKKKNVHAEI